MHQDVSLPFTATRPSGTELELGRNVLLSLARLATLQGHPITYREFELLARQLDGRTLHGVPLAGRIGALWRARFPQAQMHAPDWPPGHGDLPALWIGPRQADGSEAVLTVLGTLTNGALSSLDEQGMPVLQQPDEACCGRLLFLEPGVPAGRSQPAPGHSRSVPPGPGLPARQTPAGKLSSWIRRWLGID